MKNKAKSKILSLTLAILLAVAIIAVGAPLSASAAAVEIQEGTPTITLNQTVVGFGGKEWYVIGDGSNGVSPMTNHITLLAKDSFGTLAYNGGYAVYNGGALHTEMTNIYTAFSPNEQALISARTIDDLWDHNGGFHTNATLPNQALWPLSLAEWNTMGSFTSVPSNLFWLRSPHDGFSAWSGNLDNYQYSTDAYNTNEVRPAFNVDLSSVLFTSAASGTGTKPSNVGLNLSGASAPIQNFKFTMKDAWDAVDNTDGQRLDVYGYEGSVSGGGMRFRYNGSTATTGTNQYISCVLEQSGTVKYYGKLKDSSTITDGFVDIPFINVANGQYTLNLFSEQANGDNYTDFASEPFCMDIVVASSENTPKDTAKPTVSSVVPSGTSVAVSTSTLSVSFSEQMHTHPNKIGTVSLDNGASLSNGVWQSDHKTIQYTLSGLADSKQYTLSISGFMDIAMNQMLADSTHTFATAGQSLPPATSVSYDKYPALAKPTFVQNADGSVTLMVDATGNAPFAYRWQVGEAWIDIPGATTSPYTYKNLTPGKEYTVRCIVEDRYGYTTTSSQATFTTGQSAAATVPTFSAKGTINAKNVYVRPNANTKGKWLSKLQKGGKVDVLGYKDGFFKVAWSNEVGFAYVSADFVDAAFATPIEATAKVNTAAYTRKSTSAKYKAAAIKKGDAILLLAREGKWWKVKIGDTIGYVQTSKVVVK